MRAMVIQFVIDALCTVTKGLIKRLEDLEIRGQVETFLTVYKRISSGSFKNVTANVLTNHVY